MTTNSEAFLLCIICKIKYAVRTLGLVPLFWADPSRLQIFLGLGRGHERNFLRLRHGANSAHRKWALHQMAGGDLWIRFVQPLCEELQRNPGESTRTESESKVKRCVQFLQASAISFNMEERNITTHDTPRCYGMYISIFPSFQNSREIYRSTV